ncbi:MAG: hypothetical protein HYR56_05175 [Acidobacteria bacterium]|nr:hypothetical protein [Acidobacteriota bacterium]MBI3423640.1 hypothetical protein [Acidobacteriota bacterium]
MFAPVATDGIEGRKSDRGKHPGLPLHCHHRIFYRKRYFVGLDEAETAQALGVTARTVRRDWAFAKSWLLEYLQPRAGQH